MEAKDKKPRRWKALSVAQVAEKRAAKEAKEA
eukprot:CAMPEP_0170136964 /NCGR_PEP_ID=MMETSP0033_2-20121228/3777_1 /TAXON_ID=195969 /ORGANISM="Dolichomastix tenuilepis, Strain CCMP3274" /LENGTH=31 /DNA_ID= /DNA_START= /DNA_END= /DNA_ORIENTATION=